MGIIDQVKVLHSEGLFSNVAVLVSEISMILEVIQKCETAEFGTSSLVPLSFCYGCRW